MRVLFLGEGRVDRRVEDQLTVRGHAVVHASASEADREPIGPPLTEADLVVLDIEIAQRSDLLARLTTSCPGIEIVLVGPDTGHVHPEAIERLDRPVDPDRLLAVVDDLADVLDGEHLREPVDLVAYETVFAGDSPQIRDLLRRVRLVARSNAPVSIFGDDGSGRAIIARAIHDRSVGRAAPFVAITTTAHDDADLARLLFEGDNAAVSRARGGTLFIEGLAATGPITQRELMRYLETQPTSPRLIVGIHRDHAQRAHPAIVSDLYYRLKVLEIEIPALRERARDLEHIASRMLERLASDGKRPVMSTPTMRLIERYTFPGNLLELAHALTHAYVLARGGAIEPQHLPVSIRKAAEDMPPPDELEELDVVAKRFERDYLLRVLRSVGGNRGRAAEILGLSRKGLWGKLKAHGISDDDIDEDPVTG